ncbi:MAG TPA: conjugal transfer protein [Hyphomonadaceae bacterium]|nr:conjugal transfer protein [Hyphomonadaceae bacterium]
MTAKLARAGRLLVPVFIVLALIAAAPHALGKTFLINTTPSVPTGLYVRDYSASVERGVIVAFRQPQAARAYLGDTLGFPGDALLLKLVAAAPGDVACREATGVRVGGALRPIMEADPRGAVLPQWRECRMLASDEIFALGGHGASSFDSRYFGPVRDSDVLGVYRSFVTW